METTVPTRSNAPDAWPVVRPARVSIPLVAHPTDGQFVDRGDRVTTGQRYHRSTGRSFISPLDGVVLGSTDTLVQIELDPACALPLVPKHYDHHDRDAITAQLQAVRGADRGHWHDRIRAAGIVVNRHGCPDLAEQLRQASTRPIDTVVCNALDAESSLPFSSTLSTRFTTEMMAGISLIARAYDVPTTVSVCDAALPTRSLAAARHWSKRAGVRLARLANPYPQADPTLLLYTLLKRRLRPGRLPTEVGVILLDAAAAIAIGHLLVTGSPMTDVFVAARNVVSRAVHRAVVPVGIDVATALRGMGFIETGGALRAGTLLRDKVISPSDPVGHGELTFHVSPPEPSIDPDPCVRCGWCVEICPTRVHPAGVLDASQRNDHDMAERYGLHACIECGLCTYVCPSKLPLLRTIRWMESHGKP